MRRYEVTDGQWELIADLMPHDTRRGGRRWRDHRQVLNGIFWVLHTGAQWRELPDRYGPWKTAYNRFARWRRAGLIDRVLERLQVRLDDEGRIDWDLFCIDGTNIRASRSAAGARTGGALRTSPATTRWAAAVAGGARSSTWWWTGTVSRWPPPSPPARRASASRSSR